METDRRAIVECLLTASYTEGEIIDYLTGPLGLSEDEAMRAMRDVAGISRNRAGLNEA